MCLFFCCRLSYTAFRDMSIKSLFIFVMNCITLLVQHRITHCGAEQLQKKKGFAIRKAFVTLVA